MSKSVKKDKTGQAEKEYMFIQGAPVQTESGRFMSPDNDEAARVRHHDDETTWTCESYDNKLSTGLVMAGATEKPSLCDGRIFECDARQLIQFIAASSSLVIEFRQRKRQQLSPEQAEARRLRMSELNARQRMKA